MQNNRDRSDFAVAHNDLSTDATLVFNNEKFAPPVSVNILPNTLTISQAEKTRPV